MHHTLDSHISAPRLAIRRRILVPHVCVCKRRLPRWFQRYFKLYTFPGLPRTKQCSPTSQGDFGLHVTCILTNAECQGTCYSFSHIRLALNIINHSVYRSKTCKRKPSRRHLSLLLTLSVHTYVGPRIASPNACSPRIRFCR
jgi:hypothetical protein